MHVICGREMSLKYRGLRICSHRIPFNEILQLFSYTPELDLDFVKNA